MSTGEIFRRVAELLIFHSADRKVYYRLVRGLQQDRTNARRCLALWTWFESIGHDNFITRVSYYTDGLLTAIYEEAVRCYKAVIGGLPSYISFSIPLTATLIAEPIDLGFFLFNRQAIYDAICHITDTICNAIFDDNLRLIIYQGGQNFLSREPIKVCASIHPTLEWMAMYGPSLLPVGDGVEGQCGKVRFSEPDAETLFLRAFAEIDRRLEPETKKAKRRSLFIVFLRGYPVRREQIIEYFTSKYGNILESVTVEQSVADGRLAVYGRIVFLNLRKMMSVMEGKLNARFQIQGNYLWARTYTLPQGYGLTQDEQAGRWI